MTLQAIVLWCFATFVILPVHASSSYSSSKASCHEPLGLQNGSIADDKIKASSAYNNDFKEFGPQRARLNLPGGYRANVLHSQSSWIEVDFDEEIVITEVATQGYAGDESVKEWLTEYMVMYSRGLNSDFRPLQDSNGPKLFIGNIDRNTIQRNLVPFPLIATSVMIMQAEYHNNFALRLELYGCKPDFYFIVWLMMADSNFQMKYFDSNDEGYNYTASGATSEVEHYLRNHRGFLSATLLRFSPQYASDGETKLVAEVKILCLKGTKYYLLGALQNAMNKSALFDASYIGMQYPLDSMCRPPTVTVFLNKTALGAKKITTKDNYTVKGEVKRRCNTSRLLMIWEIHLVTSDKGVFLPALPRVFEQETITINPDMLHLGLYYVKFIAQMIGKRGSIGYDYGFFEISRPPLVATIQGHHEVEEGTGLVTLDASRSEDPDPDPESDEDLHFTWLCRRKQENFSSIASLPVDIAEGRDRTHGGCFGYGVGKLYSTKPVLQFYTREMEVDQDYVFQLCVQKDERVSLANHEFRVVKSLLFSISCTKNCGPLVSASRWMVVQSSCLGSSCAMIRRYSWSLFKMDPFSSSWIEVTDLGSTARTNLNRQTLVIPGQIEQEKGTFLKGNTTYRVKATASLTDGSTTEDEFSFRTNSDPYGGTCAVSPKNGTAIETAFNIACSGWQDEQLPLTYEYRYHSSTGMVVIAKGPDSNITTSLPVGNSSKGFLISIEIQVIDKQGASGMALTRVHVKPLESKDLRVTLMHLTKGESSTIGGLIAAGNVDKAARMAYSVLSMVEKEDGFSNEYKKSLKDSVIDQIIRVNLSSLEQVTRLAVVVTIAMDRKDEISQESQEKAAAFLERTIHYVTSQIDKDGGNLELVEKVGSSLLHGVANLMQVSSFEASVVEIGSVPAWHWDKNKKEKAKRLTEKTLKLVDQIGSTLLALKTVGEKPSVFSTKFLTMVLLRDTPDEVGGQTLSESEGEVHLPSSEALFGSSADNMKAVDLQKVEFKHNPFTWDISSKNITSEVMDFSIKTTKGLKLNISDLQKPVELYIPQTVNHSNGNTSEEYYFIKPGHIQYHRIWFPEGTVAFVEIKPQYGKLLEVYVSHRMKPSLESYDYNTTVPDYSTCQNYSRSTGYFDCSSNPFSLSLSSRITGHAGLHFLGVRYESVATPEDEGELQEVRVRKKRDCGHNGRQKRSCVGVKDPPTTPPPTPRIVIPQYNPNTDINYTMSVRMSSCMYWSETKHKWTGEGCQVGPNTGVTKLHCMCTHLSAFGGDFFVAPNPIDFDKVWSEFSKLGATGNFVVLATVCSILGLYWVALLFARRADKKDESKVVANVYLNETKVDGHVYEISVVTGMWRGYGTTANVGLNIYGEDSMSGDIHLTDPSLNKRFFSRGSVNNFTLSLLESLGPLIRIKIWHDNSGASPAWFFHQVVIRDVQNNNKYHFLGDRWLALEKGTCELEADIRVADRNELAGFKNQFYSRTAKNLGDGHIWLSIFTRPPHNTFTRCQRLSCCLSILFAVMVTNAMFYQFNQPLSETIKVGLLTLSWKQIKIGIQSSIIAIPVNLLVVTIFRNIKPKLVGDENQGIDMKTPGCLPHFFVFIGWTLCWLTSLTAAAFIVFYSLMWGKETSNQWLTSITVSFFQDVIITQPVKVVLLASLLSLIFKKPIEQDPVFGSSLSKSSAVADSDVKRLQGTELKKAREFRRKRLEMFRTIIEIAFFLFFVVLLMVVCYGNRKPSRFALTKTLDDTFSRFDKVTTMKTFWAWTKTKLVPGLYDAQWYNSRPFDYEEGFISNRENFLVGMPRLRQVRVKSESVCQTRYVQPFLVEAFSRCLPVYSDKAEDKTLYNQPRWIPVVNASQFSSQFELHDLCPKPWRYKEAKSLNTRPGAGMKDEYSGGGFVADLGYNAKSALGVLANLEAYDWIDDKTVAVFVEFTVFEPASALFSAVKYLYERFPTGGTNTVARIRTLTLYTPPDPTYRSVYQLCQLLLMLVVLFFFLAEIARLYRQQWSYFSSFWNWVALLQIVFAVAAVVMIFLKENYTSEFVKRVQHNPFETSSTDYIVFWSDMEVYLLSFVIFLVTLNLLRLIRFNRHVCQMTGTIKYSLVHMASFFIIFLAVILAYTQLAALVFGSSLSPYSSFYKSLSSLLQLIVGGNMYFYELRTISVIIGPLFIFVYTISMAMILLNMFLAILYESYRRVQEIHGGDFPDAQLGDFMSDYLRNSMLQYRETAASYYKKVLSILQRKFRRKRSTYESYFQVPQDDVDVSHSRSEHIDENAKLVNMKFASLESFTDILVDPDENEMDDVKSILSEIELDLRGSIGCVSTVSTNEESARRCCCEVETEYCSCMRRRVSLWDREAMTVWPGGLAEGRRTVQVGDEISFDRQTELPVANNSLNKSRETRL